ncbi:uncharacterized protein C8orf48 homolog [Mus pahari]|uniref:uncharacterized protein C8orf48 homolog n=1 Tax=Mus pahari TaxID=10093 RepID=UPI000A30919D|nr:uncharacterized protein C8orf48 homolog [Mus pahari]
MGWPPAQKPEDSKEEHGGPAQMDVCATQVSEEFPRSCADEVPSSGSISFSGELQSYSRTSESPLETETPTTSSEEQDEQSELSLLQKDEKKLSEKWINHLKSKEIHSERHHPDHRSPPPEIPKESAEELDALQTFCTKKVNLIHQRQDSRAKKSNRPKRLQLRWTAETSEVDAFNGRIPDEMLNRIYLENTRATLAYIGAIKQHVSSQCPSCNSKRAELAQSDFLRRRKTLLQSLLLQEKIDEHLHTTDFLTRVGDAHQGFPGLSDDPRIIWKRLTEKMQKGSSGFGRAYSKQV